MKSLMIAALAAAAISAPPAFAQEADHGEELREWVVEPCAIVASAMKVAVLDEGQAQEGMTRDALASAIMDAIEKRLEEWQETWGGEEKAFSWESRRAIYPQMLMVCLAGIPEFQLQ